MHTSTRLSTTCSNFPNPCELSYILEVDPNVPLCLFSTAVRGKTTFHKNMAARCRFFFWTRAKLCINIDHSPLYIPDFFFFFFRNLIGYYFLKSSTVKQTNFNFPGRAISCSAAVPLDVLHKLNFWHSFGDKYLKRIIWVSNNFVLIASSK